MIQKMIFFLAMATVFSSANILLLSKKTPSTSLYQATQNAVLKTNSNS